MDYDTVSVKLGLKAVEVYKEQVIYLFVCFKPITMNLELEMVVILEIIVIVS